MLSYLETIHKVSRLSSRERGSRPNRTFIAFYDAQGMRECLKTTIFDRTYFMDDPLHSKRMLN